MDLQQAGEENDTEELSNQIENLSLAEQEGRRVVAIEDDDIEETDKDLTDAVACRILTNKLIHWEVFSDTMPRIWAVE